MSSSTSGIETQTVSESLDLGVAAHRVALASSPTAPCDIYSASASATMDANSRVCLMLNTTDEDSESYVAFLKTATVRNLDSGLEYALVSNRKFGQSAPGYKYAGAWLNDAHADLAILVGAYAVGTDRPGFGRVFEEGAGLDWTETLSVEASDGAANDQFGASVALGDDYVVVGSSNGGAAYVFGGGAYVSGAAARYGRGAAALLAAVAAAL